MFGSSALSKGVSVLRKAKVIEVGNDKTNLNKIKVQFMDDPNKTTVDAEILTWFAGQKNSGSVSLPQKNDEVLVGLIDGKTDEAVVLGSLFNSKNKPIAKVDRKNEVLLNVITRQGNKLIINDGSKAQTLEITNKNGDTGIIIDFKKGNIDFIAKEKVMITVGSGKTEKFIIQNNKGITFKSVKGNLNFGADAGKFGVSSKDVQMKAISNLTCQGLNTTIKGTTKTDVNSNGMLNVKGSLLKLN
ncbi:MAG: hypothetical protein IJC57_03280 [Clostridia bacterium]|nr:hypothetical protein [Clostridia bacterium]